MQGQQALDWGLVDAVGDEVTVRRVRPGQGGVAGLVCHLAPRSGAGVTLGRLDRVIDGDTIAYSVAARHDRPRQRVLRP